MGSLISTLSGGLDATKTKVIMYVIVGIVALVIISLLLDGIRKYIRGLDTAVLGALFIWLGYEAQKYGLVKALTELLYLAGGTLVVVGLLVFIITKIVRAKRRARNRYQAKHHELEKQKAEAETAQKDSE